MNEPPDADAPFSIHQLKGFNTTINKKIERPSQLKFLLSSNQLDILGIFKSHGIVQT